METQNHALAEETEFRARGVKEGDKIPVLVSFAFFELLVESSRRVSSCGNRHVDVVLPLC